jgi:hypothetical protein
MVFQPGDDNIITHNQILASPTLRNQINALSGATDKNDILCRRRIEKMRNRITRFFIRIGCPRRQLMRRSMNFGILVLIEVLNPVNHHLWLLGRRCIIKLG